jgi:hypothetical protein
VKGGGPGHHEVDVKSGGTASLAGALAILGALAFGALGCGGVSASNDGGGTGGDRCASLRGQYAAALDTAKTCNPLVKSLQCQMTRPNALACPSCSTHVQTTTELDALQAQWTAANCQSQVFACPAIACINPDNGSCVATDGGGAGGVCKDNYTLPAT